MVLTQRVPHILIL